MERWPLLRPVVAVEVLGEGQKALQGTPLGGQGLLGLPGGFGLQVQGGQVAEAVCRRLAAGQNITGEMMGLLA